MVLGCLEVLQASLWILFLGLWMNPDVAQICFRDLRELPSAQASDRWSVKIVV